MEIGSLQTQWRQRKRSVVITTVLIPIALQAGFIIVGGLLQSWAPWYDNVLSQILSAGFGVGALIYHFRWKGAFASILYAPAMVSVLLLFTTFLGAILSGGNSLVVHQWSARRRPGAFLHRRLTSPCRMWTRAPRLTNRVLKKAGEHYAGGAFLRIPTVVE
jgi:hypothetical protein